jgi:cell division septal protein FtsQ
MIKFIDLRNYDSRPGAVWSTIDLHMKNGIVVILGPQNFELQLMRLDYLWHEKCADTLYRVKRINISTVDDATIEYR